jgi:polyhydroxybutyrate depolymerase
MATTYHINRRRVYAAGLSNGGIMTERLACDLAGKIAAAVAVEGTMSVYSSQHCAPERPVPFMLIQGTADPLVPYSGNLTNPATRDELLSAADTTAKWVALDGCTNMPTPAKVPDTAHDGTSVSSTTYTGCAGGVLVATYVVQDGGHTWPSGEQYLPVSLIGATTRQIDNATIWDFVRAFSL